MKLELELPYPPSVNHYKSIGRIIKTKSGKLFQKRVNSKKTKKFFFDVYMKSKSAMPIEWVKFACSDDISFEVYIDLYPPDGSRRDVDNGLKVLLDSLVKARVIKDDSQIRRLVVEKKYIIAGGKIDICIFSEEPDAK